MKKYFSKWLQTFSGSLKVLLVIVFIILSPLSFAKDDIADTANYLPGGQYRMFGGGRGVVSNVKNNIHSNTSVLNVGVVQFTKTRYSGSVSYQQDFSNHGWRVHSPFSSSLTQSLTDFYASIGDRKAGVVKGNVTGWEVHPADAYDGEQGGDYPSPTGARDEYTYEVSGESYSVGVKPNNEKAPISPENQANPNQNENKGYNDRQPENNPTDANDRTRDLVGSGNLPNTLPESGDITENNGEVPLPKSENYPPCVDCCPTCISPYSKEDIQPVGWNPFAQNTVNSAVGNAIAGGNAVELAEVAGISYAAAQSIIAAQQHGADKKTVSDMVSQAQATSGGAMPPDDGNDNNRKKTEPYYKNNKEAKKAAEDMGFKETKDYNFNSHGQPVYRKGNTFISRDTEGHNGGAWKVWTSNKPGTRSYTADPKLNPIKK